MWSRNIKFEGWYFKHQLGDTVVAFIPGKAESGSFIQVISSWGSRQFTVPKLKREDLARMLAHPLERAHGSQT